MSQPPEERMAYLVARGREFMRINKRGEVFIDGCLAEDNAIIVRMLRAWASWLLDKGGMP